MSRTTRRGYPTRSYSRYIRLGVIYPEKAGFISSFDHRFISMWQDHEGQSYESYLAQEILDYHRDGKRKRHHGVPRATRVLDVNAQKCAHQRAIRRALQTGDFDVVLDPLVKDNSWNYW